MWRFYVAILVSLCLSCLGVSAFANIFHGNLVLEYTTGLRTPLFTAFVTMGSFLLTLKTFILLRLKEGMYDKEFYKTAYLNNRSLASKDSYYGPLQRLGQALIVNVAMCYISSILQLTLGLLKYDWGIVICLGFGATTLGLIFFCWYQVSQNLQQWFNYIETEKQDELNKE